MLMQIGGHVALVLCSPPKENQVKLASRVKTSPVVGARLSTASAVWGRASANSLNAASRVSLVLPGNAWVFDPTAAAASRSNVINQPKGRGHYESATSRTVAASGILPATTRNCCNGVHEPAGQLP